MNSFSGKIQLRDPLSGDVRFNLQFIEGDDEDDDVLNETDERAVQGAEKEKSKKKYVSFEQMSLACSNIL